MRFGPAGPLGPRRAHVYYGTVDSTPLFVVLLGGSRGGAHPTRSLPSCSPTPTGRSTWIATTATGTATASSSTGARPPRGLVNQGWKDSWDGVNFADGRVAEAPIALAEVQGYTYAAYLARARLAEALGERRGAAVAGRAARPEGSAFNEEFWLPDQGWYAVGLDGDKRPIDALTSNIGHCLWTGIVDDDKAEPVAEHLTVARRCSAAGRPHPGDAMAGLQPDELPQRLGVASRHRAVRQRPVPATGSTEEAADLVAALWTPPAPSSDRLPELFSGFDRRSSRCPVPYPAACSPQAWAAAAPLELLRALLGLEPGRPVTCHPPAARAPPAAEDRRPRGR